VSHTPVFRAAVAIEGFYDLAGWTTIGTVIHQRMGTSPWGNLQRYLANSPYYRADQIHTPLLIIHGESDAIPVEEARKLFGALKQLDRTAQLATYAGEGHALSFWKLADGADVSRRIVEFVGRYLHASSTAAPSQ